MADPAFEIQATARGNAGVHCAYCRDVFSDGITGEPCSACDTHLHRSCWSELKSCPTTGCPGGWTGAVVAHDPSVTEHCASCGDGLLPRAGAPCSSCGTRLHRFCWDELPGCPRDGCDGGWTRELGSGSRPRVRASDASAWSSSSASRSGLDERSFGTREWFEAWVVQDPLARALTLAPPMAMFGFLAVAVVGGLTGSVYHEAHSNLSFVGLLYGAAWSIPGAAAFGAYAFLQGLVGVRQEHLRNGGMLAMLTAVLLACVGVFLTGSPMGGGITGGVIGALLGVRLFGLHMEDKN